MSVLTFSDVVLQVNAACETFPPEHVAARYAVQAAFESGYTDSGSIEAHLDVLAEGGAKFDFDMAKEAAIEEARSAIAVEIYIPVRNLAIYPEKAVSEYLSELAVEVKKQCGLGEVRTFTHDKALHSYRISTSFGNNVLVDYDIEREIPSIRDVVLELGNWRNNT